MLECTCSGLNMLIHASVLVAAFASVHDQFKIRFHHFANDLISNKSTGRECVIQLSVAFTGIVHVHFSAQTLK